MTDHERDQAIKEAERNQSGVSYFQPRSFYRITNQQAFDAGFDRGWDAATAPLLAKIAELEAKLAQLVPDGYAGSCFVSGAKEPVVSVEFDTDAHAEAFFTYLAAAPAAPEQRAPNAQQAEPPPWWPAVENILNEYGLQAVDFVADFKAAQQAEAQEPVAWANFTEDGNIRIWSKKPESANWCGLTLVPLFTRPKPAQHQLCQGEQP